MKNKVDWNFLWKYYTELLGILSIVVLVWMALFGGKISIWVDNGGLVGVILKWAMR